MHTAPLANDFHTPLDHSSLGVCSKTILGETHSHPCLGCIRATGPLHWLYYVPWSSSKWRGASSLSLSAAGMPYGSTRSSVAC